MEDPAGLRLKLDENLSRHLSESLQKLGFDAATVVEEGLQGRPDIEVGRVAREEGRILPPCVATRAVRR